MLTGGDYVLSQVFIVDSSIGSLVLVGPRVAIVDRPSTGPSLQVSNSAELEVRGLTVRKGVECIEATLVLKRALFESGGPETFPRIQAASCDVRLEDSELIASPGDGVNVTSGTLEILRSTIETGAAYGVRVNSTQVTIEQSVVVGNMEMGFRGTGTIVISRSEFQFNRRGGIALDGGIGDITNNFIVFNGNDADGTFGGLRLLLVGPTSRIEHNTVAFNDSDPSANPLYAGGIYCTEPVGTTHVLRNNIIFKNYSGNNTQPTAQVGGTCSYTDSLVANGDDTGTVLNEMHFVSEDFNDPDCHLADVTSPAMNAGVPGLVMVDFDGQPRPNGAPDLGADEFYP